MDRGEGFFGGRWFGGASDKTIINRIMLRFRPIAPKPASGGSGSGESPPEHKSEIVPKKKAKRKYVKSKKNNKCKRNTMEIEKDVSDRTVLTLQLQPEGAQRIKDSAVKRSYWNLNFPAIHNSEQHPMSMIFNREPENITAIAFSFSDQSDLTAAMPPTRVAESWVTVECVTETCMDREGLGSTDVERIKNLEVDTCPGFISGDDYKVQWISPAYKRMVWGEEVGVPPSDMAVRLVVKEELPIAYASFACRARVQYTRRKEKYSRTIPCDVWRMDFGRGFAWRLDIKAALNLGLSL